MNRTILLVEDEVLIAMAKQKELEKYGYTVFHVNTGEKAVLVSKENKGIDLILMDIDLGKGIDGTEASELIIKDRDIPVVFMSSHTESEIVEKTEKITSYGYVVKNSSITVLDASIKMAFKLFDAHRRVEQSDSRFQDILNNTKFHLWTFNGIEYTYVNRDWYDFTGQALNTALTIDLWISAIHPDDLEESGKIWKENWDKKTEHDNYFRLRRFDGVYCDFHCHAVPVFDKDGNFVYFLGTNIDITKRKQQEDQVRKFRTIIEQSPEAIVVTNILGEIEYVNPTFCSLSGYTMEELKGKNQRLLQGGKTPADIYKELWDTIKSGNIWYGELLNRKKSGELYWESEIISPIFNKNNEVINFIGIKEDISLPEQSLKSDSNFFYHTIIENIPAAICRYTNDGLIVYANNNYYNLVNNNEKELIGISIFDVINKENIDRAKNQISKLTIENPVMTHTHRLKNTKGEVKLFQWTDRIIISNSGSILGYIAIGYDVTGTDLEG